MLHLLELRQQHRLRLSSRADTVTVTYLELADPGGLRPSARPAPPGFGTRRIDDPAVNRDLYTRIGAAHAWVDRLPWSEERWRAWCDEIETHVVELDGAVIGYFELKADPRKGTAEIVIFGLLADYHGRGLGGQALSAAARRSFELGRPVLVSTNSIDGAHALDNYLARGFTVIGTRKRPRGPDEGAHRGPDPKT